MNIDSDILGFIEEVPFPHAARPLRRVGLHPRRRAGHALRLLAGGLPHGLPFLRHGPPGAARVAAGGRNPQPDRLPARARPSHEPRVHGDGRTARQPGPIAADALRHHFGVGLRLVAHARHRLHGGRRAATAAVSGRHEGPSGREPAQPLPRGAHGDHARRTGVAHRRGGL